MTAEERTGTRAAGALRHRVRQRRICSCRSDNCTQIEAGIEKSGIMKLEQLVLERNDWVPNNSRLPVLLYRDVLPLAASQEMASALKAIPSQWLAAAVANRRVWLSLSLGGA